MLVVDMIMSLLILILHAYSFNHSITYLVTIIYRHVISIAAYHTEQLSIPVSSSPPHFTLRWLQDAMPTTPTLFISDITLKTTGGPGNKCKLDQVIDFASDG